jgi:hypothetical protein
VKPDPLRDACQERCAQFGDPPCFDVVADWGDQCWCDDCKREAGVEVFEPLDPAAVIGPLL